jgi:hypothetical protein
MSRLTKRALITGEPPVILETGLGGSSARMQLAAPTFRMRVRALPHFVRSNDVAPLRGVKLGDRDRLAAASLRTAVSELLTAGA